MQRYAVKPDSSAQSVEGIPEMVGGTEGNSIRPLYNVTKQNFIT